MNKVTEARKAAEDALITRREETAAIRSQASTAKILESSPTLMRCARSGDRNFLFGARVTRPLVASGAPE